MSKAEEKNELVVIPESGVLTLFETDEIRDEIISQIEEKARDFTLDLTTKKGRDLCVSQAYLVTKSKTFLEKARKALVEDEKRRIAKIDAQGREYRDRLDALAKEIRKPVDEWIAAEKARKEKIRDTMHNAFSPMVPARLPATDLEELIQKIQDCPIDDSWEEFKAEAGERKDKTLVALRDQLIEQKTYEAEQIELARLRKEDEERRAAEAKVAEEKRLAEEKAAAKKREEAIKKEAKEKAEREAAEKIAAEKKAADEKVEAAKREAAEKIQKAKDDADAKELAKVQAREKEEAAAKKKAENVRHQRTVNRRVMQDLVLHAGVTEAQAKVIIIALATHNIRDAQINY